MKHPYTLKFWIDPSLREKHQKRILDDLKEHIEHSTCLQVDTEEKAHVAIFDRTETKVCMGAALRISIHANTPDRDVIVTDPEDVVDILLEYGSLLQRHFIVADK